MIKTAWNAVAKFLGDLIVFGTTEKRALQAFRARQAERGLVRFAPPKRGKAPGLDAGFFGFMPGYQVAKGLGVPEGGFDFEPTNLTPIAPPMRHLTDPFT